MSAAMAAVKVAMAALVAMAHMAARVGTAVCLPQDLAAKVAQVQVAARGGLAVPAPPAARAMTETVVMAAMAAMAVTARLAAKVDLAALAGLPAVSQASMAAPEMMAVQALLTQSDCCPKPALTCWPSADHRAGSQHIGGVSETRASSQAQPVLAGSVLWWERITRRLGASQCS